MFCEKISQLVRLFHELFNMELTISQIYAATQSNNVITEIYPGPENGTSKDDRQLDRL